MIYLFLFLFGIAMGSFLNVVSLRFDPDKGLFSNVNGRSHCPFCKSQLKWYELVPILSFFVQGGKCRKCKHKLSWQYPLVEILTGIIFASVYWFLITYTSYFFDSISLSFYFNAIYFIAAIWIFIFVLFLLLSLIDFRHYIIPDSINGLLFLCGVLYVFILTHYNLSGIFPTSYLGHFVGLFPVIGNLWINHLMGALIGSAFFVAIIILTRGKGMGFGDAKLGAALGMIFGWPDIIFVLSFGFIIGSIYSIILMLMKRKRMKDMVPFGPFLVLGAITVFFFGYQIIQWYFSFFSI